MRRFLSILAGLVLVLVLVILVRTFKFKSRQVAVEPVAGVRVDTLLVADHLSRAISFPTISYQDQALDPLPYRNFRRFLTATYLQTHRTLRQVLAGDQGLSLLYTWEGTDRTLKPIILLAHMDVVPVDPGTEDLWTQPPFSGNIVDRYVWGRGALDDKGSLMAIMEAVEHLLRDGFQPRRTVYLAFGHDEEIGGAEGARRLARILQDIGVEAEYILDEGMTTTNGLVPGIDTPVATVGIAEKGYMTVELAVEAEGGHSSMPPRHTALGILSQAIVRLEEHTPPASFDGPVREMFATLGPEMSWGMRTIFANMWLFGGIVRSQLSGAPTTNAMIRTTYATTMASGSSKENLLPIRASMGVNCRILPGATSSDALEYLGRVIDDKRVQVEVPGEISEPSPISDTGTSSFAALARTIREVVPGTVVAPSLVPGATDSRHYGELSANIYRFAPYRLSEDDLNRVHGTDERLAIANFVEMIRFYARLIENTAQ